MFCLLIQKCPIWIWNQSPYTGGAFSASGLVLRILSFSRSRENDSPPQNHCSCRPASLCQLLFGSYPILRNPKQSQALGHTKIPYPHRLYALYLQNADTLVLLRQPYSSPPTLSIAYNPTKKNTRFYAPFCPASPYGPAGCAHWPGCRFLWDTRRAPRAFTWMDGAPIAALWVSSQSVSYTHLDVYKRQAAEWGS